MPLLLIVYNMITRNEPYRPMGKDEYQEKVRKQKIQYIQKTIKNLEVKKDELSFA